MKHIGILAHSGDGAALCFLEMVREGARRLGAHQHPEITLSILPMGPVLAAYDQGDLAAVNAHLLRTCQRLADVVAGGARSEGRQRIALLGTRWTMEGPSYPAAFARAGVALAVPGPEERGMIDRIIFEELCQGVISDASRAHVVGIIERMKR